MDTSSSSSTIPPQLEPEPERKPEIEIEPEPEPEPLMVLIGETPTLRSLSFNQDFSCFSAATSTGYLIFNVDPFGEVFRRSFSGELFGVRMLYKSNILALVGDQYPPNKVIVWDHREFKCIRELVFGYDVKSVSIRTDCVVVALLREVFVYDLSDFKQMHRIETIDNPKGLCEVSSGSNSMVVACPGLQQGEIRVENCGSKRTKFILAHESGISCLALTQAGRTVASASIKGTLIRVFDSLDGTLLQELRRGTDRADIQSIAFSLNTQWLAVSSDKGTIHVFALKIPNETLSDLPVVPHSPASSTSFIKGVLPKSFRSEWSIAQLHLKERSHYVVGFGDRENTVVVVGMNGSFYLCSFDPKSGGEMTQLEHHRFPTPDEEEVSE